MIALMYDGLELGKFVRDANTDKLKLVINPKIKKSWLPYIFELGYDKDTDMNIVIKAWVKERVFPKNRFGSRKMLRELGLVRYDVNKIAEVTRCSLIKDPYWIVYDSNDKYETHSIRGQMGEENYPYNSLGILDEENYKWRTIK